MGGENFCLWVRMIAVPLLLAEIAPESDVRMAQIAKSAYTLATF
jgi:hypothetical protein